MLKQKKFVSHNQLKTNKQINNISFKIKQTYKNHMSVVDKARARYYQTGGYPLSSLNIFDPQEAKRTNSLQYLQQVTNLCQKLKFTPQQFTQQSAINKLKFIKAFQYSILYSKNLSSIYDTKHQQLIQKNTRLFQQLKQKKEAIKQHKQKVEKRKTEYRQMKVNQAKSVYQTFSNQIENLKSKQEELNVIKMQLQSDIQVAKYQINSPYTPQVYHQQQAQQSVHDHYSSLNSINSNPHLFNQPYNQHHNQHQYPLNSPHFNNINNHNNQAPSFSFNNNHIISNEPTTQKITQHKNEQSNFTLNNESWTIIDEQNRLQEIKNSNKNNNQKQQQYKLKISNQQQPNSKQIKRSSQKKNSKNLTVDTNANRSIKKLITFQQQQQQQLYSPTINLVINNDNNLNIEQNSFDQLNLHLVSKKSTTAQNKSNNKINNNNNKNKNNNSSTNNPSPLSQSIVNRNSVQQKSSPISNIRQDDSLFSKKLNLQSKLSNQSINNNKYNNKNNDEYQFQDDIKQTPHLNYSASSNYNNSKRVELTYSKMGQVEGDLWTSTKGKLNNNNKNQQQQLLSMRMFNHQPRRKTQQQQNHNNQLKNTIQSIKLTIYKQQQKSVSNNNQSKPKLLNNKNRQNEFIDLDDLDDLDLGIQTKNSIINIKTKQNINNIKQNISNIKQLNTNNKRPQPQIKKTLQVSIQRLQQVPQETQSDITKKGSTKNNLSQPPPALNKTNQRQYQVQQQYQQQYQQQQFEDQIQQSNNNKHKQQEVVDINNKHKQQKVVDINNKHKQQEVVDINKENKQIAIKDNNSNLNNNKSEVDIIVPSNNSLLYLTTTANNNNNKQTHHHHQLLFPDLINNTLQPINQISQNINHGLFHDLQSLANQNNKSSHHHTQQLNQLSYSQFNTINTQQLLQDDFIIPQHTTFGKKPKSKFISQNNNNNSKTQNESSMLLILQNPLESINLIKQQKPHHNQATQIIESTTFNNNSFPQQKIDKKLASYQFPQQKIDKKRSSYQKKQSSIDDQASLTQSISLQQTFQRQNTQQQIIEEQQSQVQEQIQYQFQDSSKIMQSEKQQIQKKIISIIRNKHKPKNYLNQHQNTQNPYKQIQFQIQQLINLNTTKSSISNSKSKQNNDWKNITKLFQNKINQLKKQSTATTSQVQKKLTQIQQKNIKNNQSKIKSKQSKQNLNVNNVKSSKLNNKYEVTYQQQSDQNIDLNYSQSIMKDQLKTQQFKNKKLLQLSDVPSLGQGMTNSSKFDNRNFSMEDSSGLGFSLNENSIIGLRNQLKQNEKDFKKEQSGTFKKLPDDKGQPKRENKLMAPKQQPKTQQASRSKYVKSITPTNNKSLTKESALTKIQQNKYVSIEDPLNNQIAQKKPILQKKVSVDSDDDF